MKLIICCLRSLILTTFSFVTIYKSAPITRITINLNALILLNG